MIALVAEIAGDLVSGGVTGGSLLAFLLAKELVWDRRRAATRSRSSESSGPRASAHEVEEAVEAERTRSWQGSTTRAIEGLASAGEKQRALGHKQLAVLERIEHGIDKIGKG